MPAALVDASAWIALLVARDQYHSRAVGFYREAGRGDLVTSNLALSEAYTWLIYRGHRAAAYALRTRIVAAQRVGMLRVVWVTEDIEERAWPILEQYGDHTFSIADCTSAVIARDLGIDVVFGFDSDFEVLGFRLAPR